MSYAQSALFNLAKAQTALGAIGAVFDSVAPAMRTFQAIATVPAGLATATVVIEVSNNGVNWITLGTITLSAASVTTDGFASAAPWKYTRSNVTAIGAGTSLDIIMGV